MSKLNDLANFGQSIWLDFISRPLLVEGKLKKLVDDGLRGVTSNPSIFEKAIAGSNDYDNDLRELINKDLSIDDIYETLALRDISSAADILLPVYTKTKGFDGYVSIEVSPKLAADTAATIAEGKKLFAALGKKNVMIKVPATQAGLPAITELIASGINVNVTLIFSLENYIQVAEAYLAGLKELKARGGNLNSVASVASFFVSRVDSSVDKELGKLGEASLLGKIAVANAKLSYAEYQKIFSGKEWEELAAEGARTQRVLWASTGTKNPAYSDVLYVDELIGKDTVNTIPPATLDAFLDHGVIAEKLVEGVDEAANQVATLEKLGISLTQVTDTLQVDGVKLFEDAFVTLLNALTVKVATMRAQNALSLAVEPITDAVNEASAKIFADKAIQRIWAKDYTVWSQDPTEISNRLGWLDSPDVTLKAVAEIKAFVEEVKKDGFKKVLLLGMGGSSLAPEVFAKTFGTPDNQIQLSILDSTDPDAVLNKAAEFNPEETLYIVSTKSGGTVETFSFMKYFYNLTLDKLSKGKAGKHFVAITDPGSGLEQVATELKFRKIFLNDPNIGGRYSVLSLFGMVPAALVGVDIEKLLNRAKLAALDSQIVSDKELNGNVAGKLGAILGAGAKLGKDKVTFILSESINSLGGWIEQLVAESTGKNGKGILPVDLEPILAPEYYTHDRLFVYIKLAGDDTLSQQMLLIEENNFPVVKIVLNDLYDLGREFMNWELATALSGYLLGIQPFDQPNVESAKILAREVVKKYQTEGKLDIEAPSAIDGDVKIYGSDKTDSVEALKAFLENFDAGNDSGALRSYVCLQAYLTPSEENDKGFAVLREAIQKKEDCAVTFGYGPRFLHSTGQLHKGDGGNGLFIQFTTSVKTEVKIPDEAGAKKSSMTFGVLRTAQAYGDRQALLNNKRRVLWFDVDGDLVDFLGKLAEAL